MDFFLFTPSKEFQLCILTILELTVVQDQMVDEVLIDPKRLIFLQYFFYL